MKTYLKLALTIGLLSCISLTACGRSVDGTQDTADFSNEAGFDEPLPDETFIEPEEFSESDESGESEFEDSASQNNIAIAKVPSSAQIKYLKENGLPTVLPGQVPTGFDLVDFKEESSASFGASYRAVYTGENSCEFDIVGGTGGWGAPDPVRQWAVQTPLFGEVVLEEYESEIGENYLLATVIPNPVLGKAVISDYPDAGYIISFSCEYGTFNPEQAAEILTLMKVVN
mgnify:CR=1 FL=1